MSEQKPPKIEFPCEYGIKVIGDAAPDFEAFVVSVAERHAPGIKEEHVDVNDSSKGRFSSVRLTIMATGEEQLKALFDELKASGRVHMVL
ncbi:MAG: hypothetical protein CL581_07750 [Alteromonadaceae bacterium]|uniref:HP0495 family protein n=1 Tax=unclassified Marinobacter TaxID=83889 RepID=UPI000C522076|nr:DUF493 domain-containing protein [Marinobacter sp. BGYM27]MAA64654.1 hypothetical protein [Alteromonadaceae bacterium]MBH84642.1 hypothetical protein [Alteromonadaceae bacterium]MDG5498158.1 DUF493 domain-containing protein [Marinobacter sp. BGYM27]|tara:strand:+ start:219 stop:488 length:270 start_codon:yes stop_codon:yes gene_type:complete